MNQDKDKLNAFVKRLTEDKKDHCRRNGFPLLAMAYVYEVVVKPGRLYTKVDVSRSGAYMVVNDTGEIFGIKAYGAIHRGHQYGTLDTVDQWYWGEYQAIKKQTQQPVGQGVTGKETSR